MSAREDGYVECGECGHPIEQHNTTGCTIGDSDTACSCREPWTRAEIRRVRRREGLPATWT